MAGPTFVGAGKKVKLVVKTAGIDSGEAAELIVTKKKDGSTLDTLQSKVKDNFITAEWKAKGPGPDDKENQWDVVYKAKCKGLETQAQPLLVYNDTIEVESQDKDGAVLKDAAFTLEVGSEKRTRNTGSSGKRKETGLPPGQISIDWLKPYRLVQWVDFEGPTRKAKLEKVLVAKFVYPKKDPKKGGHVQWVNLPADPKKPELGSKLKVKATLQGGKKGDKLYFTVSWKEKENSKRNSPKVEFTGGTITDWCKQGGIEAVMKDDDGKPDGYAEAELELGLAGGDVFSVTCSGSKLWTDEAIGVTNWRRVYYQVTKPKSMKLHDLVSLKKALATVFVEYEEYKRVEIADDDAGVPAGSWVDGAEFGKPGRKLLNIGDHNRDWFRGKFDDAKTPLGAHLIFCDLQYDGGKSGAFHEDVLGLKMTKRTGKKQIASPFDFDVIGKAVQDGSQFLRPGSTWTSAAPPGHPDNGKTGDLDPAWVKVDSDHDTISITLGGDPEKMVGNGTPPKGKAATDAETKHPMKVLVKFYQAKGPYLGESDGAHQLIVRSDNKKSFNSVLAHELAHSLRQTVKKVAPGLDATTHGRHYTGHDHQGDHCANGLSDDDWKKASFAGLKGLCIMFGEISSTKDPPHGVTFCPRCIPFLRADACQSLDAAAAAVRAAKAGEAHEASAAAPPPEPIYRLTISMGDPNALCAAEGTDLGRQQRMWMLGLLYQKVGSSQFDRRYADAWAHWKKVISDPPADDAAASTELVTMLKKELVSVVGREAEELALPAAGEFARIRLPGGFTATNFAPFGYPVPHHHRFDAEADFYGAETRIGALPVVVKVEVQDDAGSWAAAPAGVQVHLRLATPDAVPSGNAAGAPALRADTRVSQGTHPAPHGPDRFVRQEIAAAPPLADDPQVDNCPATRGGKRVAAAPGATYFETAARPGWNDGANAFAIPSPSPHPFAVQALTNDRGEAGFIFRPSRQGGDRYKLSAFIDPIGTRASDGTDSSAFRSETGTFVVWRTLRLSKHVVFDYPAGIASTAIPVAANGNDLGGALPALDFEGMKVEFGRCYIDFIIERTAARSRHRIGGGAWQTAIRYAQGAVGNRPRGASQTYDIPVLFPDTNTTAGLVRMLMPGTYDAGRGAAFAVAVGAEWGTLLNAFHDAFMQSFTRKATSGLVVVQAPMGDNLTIEHVGGAAGRAELSTSGVASLVRGVYLFYGNSAYTAAWFPYDANRNALHEIGHALFMPHQWLTRSATGAVGGAGHVAAEHDFSDYCIMSYQRGTRNHFDYCGRCNLKLRGWDTRGLRPNTSWRAGT